MTLDDKEVAAIQALEEKYLDLVWLALKRPEDLAIPGVADQVARVEESYPDEVEALRSADGGDWTHGFNSGMLAAVRFLMSMKAHGLDEAHEMFPELDT